MKKLKLELVALRGQLKTKVESLDELINKIEGDENSQSRNFTEEEKTAYDTLNSEISDLESQINQKESILDTQKRNAERLISLGQMGNLGGSDGESHEKRKMSEQFSLLRAISKVLGNKPLDGVEAEIHQMGIEESRSLNLSSAGQISLPSEMMRTVHTAGDAGQAGNLIKTEYGPMIPVLRPEPKLQKLGATFMTGLVGNFEMTIDEAELNATWRGEQDDATETDTSVGKLAMSPKGLSAYTEFSRQLELQTSPSVETMLRTKLSRAVGRKIDITGYNGSGLGNVPLGLLGRSIGNVVSGGTVTRPNLLKLRRLIMDENAEVENMQFMTTPGVQEMLANTKVDAGSGIFLWKDNDVLIGYNANTSTLVPNDLDDGGGNLDRHALIFGNWAELFVGNWGGAHLIINPYANDKRDDVRITIHTYWDMDVAHNESFAAIKDIQA